MSKKAIALLMAGCMVGSMVAPAGTVMAQESDLSGTKITFLNTKTEIQDYLEDMGAAFKEETGIEVEFYTEYGREPYYREVCSRGAVHHYDDGLSGCGRLSGISV